ncbi:hypothetical protein [Bradyrhizobium sp. Bra78]|uniref:hypothetical protein n=1 Tax=Bradyrhizobium sp. Bra78 TaxID=2926010 RepID=UPI0021C8A3AF|nr:hypothetical protein [Bradyrhizobium sp. Bra78]
MAENEADIHASEMVRGKGHSFDEGERYSFFKAIMERDAATFGFHFDKARSRSDRPVFSKAVAGDWSL